MDRGKVVRVRASQNARVAVTQYQVLSSTVSSALVELQPVTGKGAPFCGKVASTLGPQPLLASGLVLSCWHCGRAEGAT